MTRQRKSGKPKAGQMRLFGTLAGMVSCCSKWQKSGISPSGKPFYRCIEFAPTCTPPADDCLEMKNRRPDEDEDQQQDIDKIKAKRDVFLGRRRYARGQKAATKKAKPVAAPKKAPAKGKDTLSDKDISEVFAFIHKDDPRKYSEYVKHDDRWYGVFEKPPPSGQREMRMSTETIHFLPISRKIIERQNAYNIEYQTKIARETEKAIQIELARTTVPTKDKSKETRERKKEEWLPKSQIMEIRNNLFVIPEWLKKDKMLDSGSLLKFDDLT